MTLRRRRRIAVVTGSRAEYGLLQSTLGAITRSTALELQLVVAGMHLLPPFGGTVRQIERDGWPIAARVRMQRGDDSALDQAMGAARGVDGVARAIERLRPDVVVVLGDRIEALAAAVAAVTTGRVLAHIHGGDVAPGDLDEAIRHAITKLAHLHLPATEDAARRIRRMGEAADRVHVVGAVGLDRLREIRREMGLAAPREDAALVLQHPTGRRAAVERRTMSMLLEAARAAALRRIVIHPNSDRGFSGVVAAIESHVRRSAAEEVEVHRSLPRDEYLRRLLSVRVLMGNSSSGIIEAPAAGTPTVDVGDRQHGRLASGPGVVRAAESAGAVAAALRRALRMGPALRRRAGRVRADGLAGERVARVLASVDLDMLRRAKQITY